MPRPRGAPVARRGLLELVRLFALPGDHRNTCGQARALRAAAPAAAAVPRLQQVAPRPRAVDATFKCSRAPRAPGAAHRASLDKCAARRRPRRLVRAETQSVARPSGARRRSVEALRKVLTRYASRDKRAAFRLFVDVTRLYQTQSRAARQLIRVFNRALRKQKAAHLATGMRHWRAYVVEKRHADHRRDLRLLDLRKCVARFGRGRSPSRSCGGRRASRPVSAAALAVELRAPQAQGGVPSLGRGRDRAPRHLRSGPPPLAYSSPHLCEVVCGVSPAGSWRGDIMRTQSNRTRALARVARRFSSTGARSRSARGCAWRRARGAGPSGSGGATRMIH